VPNIDSHFHCDPICSEGLASAFNTTESGLGFGRRIPSNILFGLRIPPDPDLAPPRTTISCGAVHGNLDLDPAPQENLLLSFTFFAPLPTAPRCTMSLLIALIGGVEGPERRRCRLERPFLPTYRETELSGYWLHAASCNRWVNRLQALRCSQSSELSYPSGVHGSGLHQDCSGSNCCERAILASPEFARCRTVCEHRNRNGRPLSASAGENAGRAPALIRGCALAAVRLYTVRENPALSRSDAMPAPMVPRPNSAIF
jgi:hypothetical protein